MTGCGVAVKVNAVSAASDWNDEGGGMHVLTML